MKTPTLASLIALLLTFSSAAWADITQDYRAYIAWFQTHDPAADATQNFEKGTIHVFSAMGAGQYYPGLDHAIGTLIEKKHGVKDLKHMSDAVQGALHMQYMTAANVYAAEYNRTTARLLKLEVKPKTP
ncbi:MAG: hypothetical protein ACO1TE_17505 [Prosthecobacter sp.]